MDIYHIFCDLKPGVRDTDFTDALEKYFGYLKVEGLIAGWRLMRAKLGLKPAHLTEFHIMLEFEDLAQMDRAFGLVSTRAGVVEGFHHAVNAKVDRVFFALYRDFPDPQRVQGQERF